MGPRLRLVAVVFAALTLAALALAGVAPSASADGTGRITITPTIDPPGEVDSQAVPTGSRYKVRDSDGNVVAEGGISGSGGQRGNYQNETVDLPPGEYTVEVRHHGAGDRHAEGTRDYRGTHTVTVKEDTNSAVEVEVEPRNPEQHLGDQIQHQEDLLKKAEDAVTEMENDIAGHRRRGEDVGQEHTDMLDDLNDDVDAYKDRLRRMRRQLRDMRRQRLGGAGKGAADAAKGIRVPPVHRTQGGSKIPVKKGKY